MRRLLMTYAILALLGAGSELYAQSTPSAMNPKPSCAMGDVKKFVEESESILNADGGFEGVETQTLNGTVVHRLPNILVRQFWQENRFTLDVYGFIRNRLEPESKSSSDSLGRIKMETRITYFHWRVAPRCQTELAAALLATMDSDMRDRTTVYFIP